MLPFCKPKPREAPRHKWGGLGEVLQGNELIDSGLELKFRTDLPKKDICTVSLDDEKVGRRWQGICLWVVECVTGCGDAVGRAGLGVVGGWVARHQNRSGQGAGSPRAI